MSYFQRMPWSTQDPQVSRWSPPRPWLVASPEHEEKRPSPAPSSNEISTPRDKAFTKISDTSRKRIQDSLGVWLDFSTTIPICSMASNIEQWNARRKKLDQELDAKSAPCRLLLQKHLLQMKKTHAYIVRGSLTAARLDVNARGFYDGTPGSGTPGISYDEVSPFVGLGSIDITVTEARERKIDVGRFYIRHHSKPHALSEHRLTIPTKVAETPKNLEKVPKYHSYTTLRNNILSDDDEIMRYYPYLGDEAGDDEINQLSAEETFIDRTRATAEEGKKDECAAMYTTFIHDFLHDLGLGFDAIVGYLVGDITGINNGISQTRSESLRISALPNDFDLEDVKIKALRERLGTVTMEELEKAESVCRIFKQQTKISLWDVVKRVAPGVKDCLSSVKVTNGGGVFAKDTEEGTNEREIAAQTGGNPIPYSLESYATLNCLLCYMHECRFHLSKDHDRLAMSGGDDDDDDDVDVTKPTKKGDVIPLIVATSIPGWASMSKGATVDPWGGKDEECSVGCFIKVNLVVLWNFLG
ncbi:hypothetical protein L873DRAFT_183359 [Choiromyces venosus 120613-1]|uniref:Uncharacterized protein n=1 Tax=Choiromyces venosus 120613-1 TaxID=1336337 RepID=A0A3N4J7C0_9PEZI|nr:hypothetical protein L873DRAFT_183359 [Choiromyces venosus 120613-1]